MVCAPAARQNQDVPDLEEPDTAASPVPPVSPRALDRLFEARTVLLFGEINAALAERVSAQLLALASASDDPIRLYLNSPGGHVEAGDTLYDLIRFITPQVRVIGSGWVASAGALIYAACAREDRLALPNTRFMLHEPSGGVRGPASDIEIEARQVLAIRSRLNAIFAEAVDYGLVGNIVRRAEEA